LGQQRDTFDEKKRKSIIYVNAILNLRRFPRQKNKILIHKEKRVLKGKNFPFIRRKTTHRPRKKFRLKLFFLSYMLTPSSKIIAHAIPLRHIVPFFCPFVSACTQYICNKKAMNEILNYIMVFLFGGGLVGTATAFVTIKYTKKRAEADAMKAMQDVYQEMITDQRSYINSLKQDKEDSEARWENKVETLSKRIETMDLKINENNRLITELKTMKCTDLICQNRKQ
jgi:hypothetical protein